MVKRFWNEEAGFIVSAELVLVATILVIGMITGLTSVRDAVITELADVGQAISNINQSYSIGGVSGRSASTPGSLFIDQTDFCDVSSSSCESRCLVICGIGTAEAIHP